MSFFGETRLISVQLAVQLTEPPAHFGELTLLPLQGLLGLGDFLLALPHIGGQHAFELLRAFALDAVHVDLQELRKHRRVFELQPPVTLYHLRSFHYFK